VPAYPSCPEKEATKCLSVFYLVITRGRSCSFAKYLKHFIARLNDVYTFGYNFAGSEPIWVKFGALMSTLFATVPGRFWVQWRRSESEQKFCCFLSGKQRAILPTSSRPNFTKFAHKTWIRKAVNPFGTKF